MYYFLYENDKIYENGEKYHTYGIKVSYNNTEKLIEDISTDYQFVQSIINKFIKYNLEPIHIYEAIENTFADLWNQFF